MIICEWQVPSDHYKLKNKQMKIKYILIGLLCLTGCSKEALEEALEEPIIELENGKAVNSYFPETPSDESSSLVLPYVSFNYPLDSAININAETIVRIRFDSVQAFLPDSNKIVDGLYFFANDRRKVYFQPSILFSQGTKIKITVFYQWQIYENNIWKETIQLTDQTSRFTFSYRISDALPGNISMITQNDSPIDLYKVFEIHSDEKLDTELTHPCRDYPFKMIIDSVYVLKNTTDCINGIINPIDENNFNFTVDSLPSNQEIKVIINKHFEVFIGNQWFSPENSNYQSSFVFQTKERVNSGLSDAMIKATYPMNKQLYFLKEEYPQGMIIIKDEYCMELGSNVEYFAYMENIETNEIDSMLMSYNSQANKFTFEIPYALQNSTIYKFYCHSFINGKKTNSKAFNYYFRTSKYGTFSQKISQWSFRNSYSYPETNYIYTIGKAYDIKANVEYIDLFERDIFLKANFVSFNYPLFVNQPYGDIKLPDVILTLNDDIINGISGIDESNIRILGFFSGPIKREDMRFATNYIYILKYVLPDGTVTFSEQYDFKIL